MKKIHLILIIAVAECKTRMDYMVSELKRCQTANGKGKG
jgi:hypothetical protein